MQTNGTPGERIKLLRVCLGLSQREFGHRLGCYRSHVGKWETGDNVPAARSIRKIANAFQVPIPWIQGYGADEEVREWL